jgi:hypothetical protein
MHFAGRIHAFVGAARRSLDLVEERRLGAAEHI